MPAKYPTRVEELPNEEFYAILTPKSVTIPGDERSRQAPGHGYPEHTEDSWSIEVFTVYAQWLDTIVALEKRSGHSPYKAVIIKPSKVETKVSITP